MNKLIIGAAVAIMLFAGVKLSLQAAGQARGRGGAVAAEQQAPPTIFLGCVGGGNLQPVEQPFALEPADPWILIDVLTRADRGFAPTNYRVTGITLTPWLGMRVRVEGTLVPPGPGTTGSSALPEIKATRVTSVWGTCPSPAAWTPPAKD